MTAKKSASDRIDVEIFGSTYTLRGGSDPEAVRALARKLDAQMRDLASPGSDPLKVAILAALRLADETRETTEEALLREAEISGRVVALTARIEDALRPDAVPPRADGPGAALDG